ncbi:hypothetical protein F511_16759 [Dorcoceras hygrometricum]|uniref:Uncharacterized protein n=1 Tax=Dorcoceras hygrometricum TaxID=472368 RepID=A0A2Z7CRE5_9LAMI|nr:hypothetical protein F511_16759 [Dorcoceras hygrometricum]
MPSRRGRSRIARQAGEEYRAPGSDEDVEHQSIPLRRRARQTEVDDVTRQIGEMELVLARFQRMNPPTFTGAEGGLLAESWLEHIEELFDAVEYSQARRLKLAVLQLRGECSMLVEGYFTSHEREWYYDVTPQTPMGVTGSKEKGIKGKQKG